MIGNIFFTLNIVAPVFVIVFLGIILKKIFFIDSHFLESSSNLVFKISMPALVFLAISRCSPADVFRWSDLGLVYGGTILFFLLAWWIAGFISADPKSQASFTQGCFRSNFAIIGLPLIKNWLGSDALSHAALLLSMIMPLYNILAVLALTIPLQQSFHPQKIIKEILTNPLIIATVLGLLFATIPIPLPQIALETLDSLADLTFPLSLLGIGASLNFSHFKSNRVMVMTAVLIKTILIPLVLTSVAWLLNDRGDHLAILFILFSAPTAVASFMMAKAMDADFQLAATIVVTATLTSVFSISAGIFIMKSFNLLG